MTEKIQRNVRLLSILSALCLLLAMLPGSAYSQSAAAVVQGVEGEANAYTNGYKDIVKLGNGSAIQPLTMINTGAKSRAMLLWNGGLFTSLGASSSLSSVSEHPNGPVSQIQVVEGIARFKTDPTAANPARYTVATPIASIRPAAGDQPVDYVVEVYDPSTTILTVLSGKVGVVNSSSGSQQETVYGSCRTVYLTQGKQPEVGPISGDAVAKLVNATTIAGTLPLPETCPVVMAPEAAPSEAAAPVISEYTPEYYVDNTYVDFYPYEDVTVLPFYGGGYWCRLADIGDWFIPYNYWVSPAIVQIFANQYLINRAMYMNHAYINDLANRQVKLQQVLDTATQTGNLALAARARNELNVLQARQTWARQKLAGLQTREANLRTAGGRSGRQLPGGGSALANTVATSFTNSRNAKVAKGFVNRLQNQTNLENRLTTLAQNQANTLSGKLASVKDPAQRLAARTQLATMTQDLAHGKIPFTAKDSHIGKVAQDLRKTQDPIRRQAIQGQMLSTLKQAIPTGTQLGALSNHSLAALRNDVNRVPNTTVRRNLSKQLANIQQAAKSSKTQPNLLTSLGQGQGMKGKGFTPSWKPGTGHGIAGAGEQGKNFANQPP